MTFIVAHAQAPFIFGNTEAFIVALSTVIIFAFMGPKLWADFKTN
jgi:hypothetical protein